MRRRSISVKSTLLLLALMLGASTILYSSQPDIPAREQAIVRDFPLGRGGHDGAEGVVLAASSGESVYRKAYCPDSAPLRAFEVAAINVEISLNRYLDYDPQGVMYVLEQDLQRVRQEEAQNKAARSGRGQPAVSVGLQGDAIQPLVLRANQGECVRITLRNAMSSGAPASLHIHGSALYVATSGVPAIATNPEAIARSGERVIYEWWIGEDEPESTHYFHSHGDDRKQSAHGLFGALIVEPKGSRYLNPLGGGELASGWAAMIQRPDGQSFREFAFIYHEIGNERYQHRTGQGLAAPQIDPFSGAYKPGGRALNYRSEPFMNRLLLQQQIGNKFDESLAYSSYSFGDPATPIARSYLGERTKQRVIHGGSEVFHVHHVHGGAIRWPRQPGVEQLDHAANQHDHGPGIHKHPPLTLATDRLDSQTVGPSEEYDLENECGSGGCQQSAGDYLVHCHVAHHYFAGMWLIWRVYNTGQHGLASTDPLPPLSELPDRQGTVAAGVPSEALIGKTVSWGDKSFQITSANLAEWVERQLPPRGVPQEYDASVFNWDKQGDRYLNEPETTESWPGYTSRAPGERPPILLDPLTGKLAYPLLRPHLGKRPPFAPNHGPAPFLEPLHQGTDAPLPGENGSTSLCPSGTTVRQHAIHAIALPIPINQQASLIDPAGELFVLKQEEQQVRADNGRKLPLAIRANAGEDCVDIIFKSELEDSRENSLFAKVNMHIHFVQFDVQASDGVETGFNYEQGLRPFTIEGERIVTPARVGDSSVQLSSASRFQPGALVGVGMDEDETFEIRQITSIQGSTLSFSEPLEHDHAADEIVSTEFVRYRWYPDVQFGTAYFHDHVNALSSWKHGLFGALISEPPGSTYHDPYSGQPLASGPIADIHTQAPVSADVTGSFREMVTFIQDENLFTQQEKSSGSALNMRAEPLDQRAGDPARLFSSAVHGDPETPVLEAYLGDPIVMRSLVPATNDVHTWHIDGHWFRVEPYSKSSPPVSTAHIGISERLDLVLPYAGGVQNMPGDYLFYNGRSFKLSEGSWGLLRVLGEQGELRPLPGREQIPQAATQLCPSGAPEKRFDVAAIEAPLPMLGGKPGKLYVLESDKAALLSGTRPPEPLVLRVNVGDCLTISLANQTSAGAVSFHADMLAHDPQRSQGVEAGNNQPQAVAPGETRSYTLYAHPQIGETTALVRDWGNVLGNPRLGLYGAIVVGPQGSSYSDPITGEDLALRSSWQADVHPPSGGSYRDFALFLQDEDAAIGTAIMPYTEQVAGVTAINYQAEPLARRLSQNPDTASIFRMAVHQRPATPLLQAFAGDRIRLRVLAPVSEQAHVFTLEGHQWPFEPGRAGSDRLSSVQVGALEAITIEPLGGAGGQGGLPGNYLYGDHREPYREAGMWGLLRVFPREQTNAPIRALPR